MTGATGSELSEWDSALPVNGNNTGERPRLGKFMENIYREQYYNQSALYDYVVAFYTGYQMQDYAFADECLTYSTETLD